jgi:actin-related protein
MLGGILFLNHLKFCSPNLQDDIGAVVINVGRFETRVGEAGEETPKYVIPSVCYFDIIY